ncbi:MAG: 3-isopropylmalate dehydrogenase [Microscillaceae bacterium]|nr:3-isopropylmalate dehydrogenase [Microscillaceae bacterium]
MKKKIAVLPGDGIGPEVIAQSIKVLNSIARRFNHEFVYQYADVGAMAIDKTGNPLPESTLQTCMEADAVLFGAIGHPRFDNDPNAKVRPEQAILGLRKQLGLFANIRPVTTYASLAEISPLKAHITQGVDFVIYRELTGGIYFGEKKRDQDQASDLCVYSRMEIERIARLAFEAAGLRRRKLTLVDKANVLETSRLWRDTVAKLASEYPDIEMDCMFVDNAAMQLILNPGQFDVILTENMFGDILSDEASTITGSMGLLPSASVGTGNSLFEPIHGSYPQAAGQDIANPMAAILSAAMMLDHFGMHAEAKLVRDTVTEAIEEGLVTKDLNPKEFFPCSVLGDLLAAIIEGEDRNKLNPKNMIISAITII